MAPCNRVLVIGAFGQIGSELVPLLRERYGRESVIASGIHLPASAHDDGPATQLDVTDREALARLVTEQGVDCIINMAALLSSDGEKNPQLCWRVNIDGLYNVLEVARDQGVGRVFCPSSIAVFGPDTPRDNTPQETILRPATMYGVTKVSGEMLCDYYWRRFGVDARGLRYPGIISSAVFPSGGTTDYAVEIFYKAVEQGSYECFLGPDTALPMMYMPDCLDATVALLEAPVERLKHHGDFNISAMSFTPAELAEEIRRHLPDFTITYNPDHRQAIADSWPSSIDDSAAREEWGWLPKYDLAAMTADMLTRLKDKFETGQLYSMKS